MPVVPINYLAVLVAAVANMAVGFMWYGPLFGKQWMALVGLDQAKLDVLKQKSMAGTYALAFLGSLVMAYVLHHAIVFAGFYLEVTGVSAGLMSAFWNWLGFVVPVMLGAVLWEGKSWTLWLLNSGYYLVALLVMGAIIGAMA